jgi:hypothetical protein
MCEDKNSTSRWVAPYVWSNNMSILYLYAKPWGVYVGTNFKGNLMVEEAVFYESLLNFYLKTRCRYPENSKTHSPPPPFLRTSTSFKLSVSSMFSIKLRLKKNLKL